MRVLAADIGGTKTLLQVTDWTAPESPRVLVEQRYPSGNYPRFDALVQAFLTEWGGRASDLAGACFAVAGPVTETSAEATNLSWRLDSAHLQAEFRLPQVTLINDFRAIGYGIEGLRPADLAVLQAGEFKAKEPQAVIGAGTGLGQALLVWQEKKACYRVMSTEGGHVDFAPLGEVQIALWRYLVRHLRLDHISYERVLSGGGLANLYHFLKETGDIAEAPALRQALEEGDPAAAISRFALERQDPLAGRALDLFARIYGAQAGNVALACLPRGGLFLAGGMAPKILAQLQAGGFMEAFLSKGRLSNLLREIPVKVILEPRVGLWGAARLAVRLARERLRL